MARNAGIRSKLNSYFAIGLGAEAANPLEMARAYATFANGGNRIDGSVLGNVPRAITQIGKRKNEVVPRRVLSPTKTAILNSILQKVVTEGTGQRAALGDRPVAGKTGTTENYGDAWFVGYVPQLVVAVWVGYPRELRPMMTEYHGDPVAGGTFPAEIWHTFMEKALPYLHDDPESFPSTYIPYGSPEEVVFRDGSAPAATTGTAIRRATCSSSTGRGPARPPTAGRTRSTSRTSSASPFRLRPPG